MNNKELIEKLVEKYENLGENPETYFKGLLQAKPITYWDYIQVDTLLTLQKPRTNFKDEEIFIMYHQVVELTLKLMVHEVKQLTGENNQSEAIFIDKLSRMLRYTDMLITSFDVMKDGMNYDDYNTFRSSLTPASGFQSAQFRFLEIYCTPLKNLINQKGKERLPKNPSIEDYFDYIYWKDAGHDRKTDTKTLTLRLFEEKYLSDFIALAKKMQGETLMEKFEKMENPSKDLIQKVKKFDHFFNVVWPLVHLNTAQHYLDKKGVTQAATGGSEWKKYLHPKYQQRKFFPNVWTPEEIANWGNS